MESDIVAVLRKAKIVKARLESLDRSNISNRRVSELYKEGSPVDRTRIPVTNGSRVKLREIMNEFQILRQKILSDYKNDLKRRYYTATGEEPSEEEIEDIQRSLKRLHQVFLDMAVLIETQGEKMDDIEENVTNAGNFLSGGTNSLYYANQMKKKRKTWFLWVFAVMLGKGII